MLRPATIIRCCQKPSLARKFALRHPRYESSVIIRQPSPSAPREAPTPLVFAYAKGWYEKDAKASLRTCAVTFAEQGFTTLEVELDPVRKSHAMPKSCHEVLDVYAKELSRQIMLFNIFPPVLVTRGVATLIGHTYVESFPLSGLALMGPSTLVPKSLHLPDTWKAGSYPEELGSHSPIFSIPDFTYEARFPILHLEASATRNHNEDTLSNTDPAVSSSLDIDLRTMASLDDEKAIVAELKAWLNIVGL